MTNVKAIALCRVSTQGQANEGNLVPQEENVQAAAGILGVEIDRIWSLAVSSRKGKNMNRKDLREMHEYCKRYKSVKYLIVDEVDRFMRSIEEYYWWKMEFKVLGVRLILAKRPDINPDDDRAVFDELIDIYRAQQSNQERIEKTPAKMMNKLNAGYYPSNPHTGYKRSDVPGLHIPDEPNWSIMRTAFRHMAAGEMNIAEGLAWANEQGLRTKNYGPKAVGGNKIDMYRWKGLMVDDYYWGRLRFADWELREDLIGLHKPMITKDEHDILVRIVKNKGKRFSPKFNNPEFILSNVAECARCLGLGCAYPRLVGFWQGNGKAKGYKRYRRYRCRCKDCGCRLGLRQEVLNQMVSDELKALKLSPIQQDKLKQNLRKLWATHEKTLIERAYIAEGQLRVLRDRKRAMVDSYSTEADANLKGDIKERIDELSIEIIEAEKAANDAQDFEKDFDDFVCFAFDFMRDKDARWWDLDKQTLVVYKQILFPAGIQVTQDRKVYIPKVSPVYTYKTQESSHIETILADFVSHGGSSGA